MAAQEWRADRRYLFAGTLAMAGAPFEPSRQFDARRHLPDSGGVAGVAILAAIGRGSAARPGPLWQPYLVSQQYYKVALELRSAGQLVVYDYYLTNAGSGRHTFTFTVPNYATALSVERVLKGRSECVCGPRGQL